MNPAVDVMEPRLLRSFVAVAEELHFGRAAARLHMTQPPLSVQIRKLEGELGARLFDRDRRSVALTEAGVFLLERAKHILAESERSRVEAGRIARGEGGVLAVGYTTTATYEILPPLVGALRRRSPEVRLELVEMRSGAQPDALRSGRIEVGLACGPLPSESAHGLTARVLARERFVAVLPTTHPLAKKERLRVRDLDGQAAVLVDPEVEPVWALACSRALSRQGATLDVVQETDTKIALLGLVAAGLGLSVVSASMMRLARDGVVFREIDGLPLRAPLIALHRTEPSPRVALLMSLAKASLFGPRTPIRERSHRRASRRP